MGEPSQRERFEATVLVHLDAAYGLARWLLRDDSAAEDVVQDASLRAYRFFDAMHSASPKAWFMAIVRNACMDWIGSTKRRSVEQRYDNELHDVAALDRNGGIVSPESMAILASDTRRLQACLEALPFEFREVLVLREMQELSYREISEVVGVPMGTVMSRLARGRDRLAGLMCAPLKRKLP